MSPPRSNEVMPPLRAPVDLALLPLAAELGVSGRKVALENEAHFRPLCDDKGYPLVGNVMAKGPSDSYKPSEFCADIRAEKQ